MYWRSPLSRFPLWVSGALLSLGSCLRKSRVLGGLRNPFSPLSLSRLLGLLGCCPSGGVPVSGFWWSQDSPSRLPGVPLLHCCHSPFSPFQGSWGSPLSQPSLGVPKTGVSPSPPGLRSLHMAPGRAWRAQPRKPNPHHGEDSHPPALHQGSASSLYRSPPKTPPGDSPVSPQGAFAAWLWSPARSKHHASILLQKKETGSPKYILCELQIFLPPSKKATQDI